MIFRNENKYFVTETEIKIIKSRLNVLMKTDPHAGSDGNYNISSLYFDDYFNTCYNENECGISSRKKYRIRVYNHDSGRIILECKRKENQKGTKESCKLSISQYEDIIAGKPPENTADQPPLLQRLGLLMRMSRFRPVVTVEYDRTAFIYKTGNVRITFDRNLRASGKPEHFLSNDDLKIPVMPKNIHLLEIKWDDYLPPHLLEALQLRGMKQVSFSKFYACRSLFI